MPRKPRSLVLFDGCTTHKVWRAHNKEWYLQESSIKTLYIDSLLKSQNSDIKWDYELNALCIMSNHVHEIVKINDLSDFSALMRKHHSRFGIRYNKIKKRSGKVAEERPHTTCFEHNEHSMEAVFYTHANPLKAGIIKDERAYYWSTHVYYAFGKKPNFLKGLKFKFPEWYIKLGKTFSERQKKYRKLFKEYLMKSKKFSNNNQFSKIQFFGSPLWTLSKNDIVKEYLNVLREKRKIDSS